MSSRDASRGSCAYTIIRGGFVLDIRRHRFERSDILIAADRIVELGPPTLAAPDGAYVVDASQQLLLPGLVNAHTHGHGHLGKGMGDAWTLELLLNAGPYLNGGRSLEDKEMACLLGGLDMIRHGTTACYDLFVELPLPSLEGLRAAARGYAQAGVRVTLAPMFADRSFYEAIPGLLDALPPHLKKIAERYRSAPSDTTLAELRSIIDGWTADSDKVRLGLAPTIPQHCSDELMLASRDLARDHGLRLHMHVAESRVQAVTGMRRYGKSLVRHLASLDVLGPNFTAAHAIWVDRDDIAVLADAGVGVAHNPGSNLRLGSGVAPVREMLDSSISVGIGTDGAHCSDHQNMFEALRMASIVSRVASPDPARWLRSEEALVLATTGGARVLGFEDLIGQLAPGYKADIVFLDLRNLNYVPLNDPVNQLVNVENGAAVDSVMINGTFVYRERRFPTVDIEAVRRRVASRVTELRSRNAAAETFARAVESAVGSFCIGLAREHYHVHRLLG
jgi:5-methylthioadenosine/S-adenosylhomocysteine deaminase